MYSAVALQAVIPPFPEGSVEPQRRFIYEIPALTYQKDLSELLRASVWLPAHLILHLQC